MGSVSCPRHSQQTHADMYARLLARSCFLGLAWLGVLGVLRVIFDSLFLITGLANAHTARIRYSYLFSPPLFLYCRAFQRPWAIPGPWLSSFLFMNIRPAPNLRRTPQTAQSSGSSRSIATAAPTTTNPARYATGNRQ